MLSFNSSKNALSYSLLVFSQLKLISQWTNFHTASEWGNCDLCDYFILIALVCCSTVGNICRTTDYLSFGEFLWPDYYNHYNYETWSATGILRKKGTLVKERNSNCRLKLLYKSTGLGRFSRFVGSKPWYWWDNLGGGGAGGRGRKPISKLLGGLAPADPRSPHPCSYTYEMSECSFHRLSEIGYTSWPSYFLCWSHSNSDLVHFHYQRIRK